MAPSPTYRFEHAKSNRAGCRNTVCKQQGIKIEKGEPRLGTLVQLPQIENPTWMWSHWGCVSPSIIKNIQDMVEGLDVDTDLDVLDGWDEIDEDFQEKIKQAIRDGHVSDEDWRGAPELNRPGMKGINRRTPKKKAVEADPEEPAGTPESPVPKKKTTVKKRKAEADLSDEEEAVPKPKKKAAPKKKAKVEAEMSDESEEAFAPAPKTTAKGRGKKAVKEEADDDEVAPKKKTKPRGKAKKEDSEEEVIPPPQKGASRAKKQEPDADDDTALPAPKPKKGRAKKEVKPEPVDAVDLANVKGEPEEELEPKPKRGRKTKMEDIEQAAEPVEAEETKLEPRTRRRSVKKEAADADAPPTAPAKAKRGRKVKQEPSPSPEPEVNAEPETPDPVKAEPDVANESTKLEPQYPVIAQMDGAADKDVYVKKKGRKIKAEVPVVSDEPVMPTRVKKERKGSKIKTEVNMKLEEAADALADVANDVKKEVIAAKGKGRGRKAKKEEA